ncbi:MAG: hypothetical protein JWP72_1129 [Massilia sp.]|nr:hypothetical protein [Massilia sp.]MDB5792009.1 hypothetical protein [Massilia sp.]
MVQRIRTTLDPSSRDLSAATGLATSDPSNYWKLHASYDIARGHTLDMMLRHYGKVNRPAVPAYESLDINYSWRISPGVELSVSGRKLFDASHTEFGTGPTAPVFERHVGINLVWRL